MLAASFWRQCRDPKKECKHDSDDLSFSLALFVQSIKFHYQEHVVTLGSKGFPSRFDFVFCLPVK